MLILIMQLIQVTIFKSLSLQDLYKQLECNWVAAIESTKFKQDLFLKIPVQVCFKISRLLYQANQMFKSNLVSNYLKFIVWSANQSNLEFSFLQVKYFSCILAWILPQCTFQLLIWTTQQPLFVHQSLLISSKFYRPILWSFLFKLRVQFHLKEALFEALSSFNRWFYSLQPFLFSIQLDKHMSMRFQ